MKISRFVLGLAALSPLANPLPAHGQQGGGGLEPGLHVTTREQRYDIDLPGLAAVIDSLNVTRLSPERREPSQGLTVYEIVPRWRTTVTADRCTMNAVEVRVDITVTLPAWPGVGRAKEQHVEDWRRLVVRFQVHEYAHRDATIDEAGALLTELMFLRERRCGDLDRAARRVVSAANRRLDARHEELDRSGVGGG